MDVMRAQGKTAQIVEEYRAEVAKNPSSGVYHYLLGRALTIAMKSFSRSRKPSKSIQITRGGILGWEPSTLIRATSMKQSQPGKLLFNTILMTHWRISIWASLMKRKGNSTRRLRRTRPLINVDPNNAAAYVDLGNVYGQVGELDKAAAAYERAINIDPTYAYAQMSLQLDDRARGKLYEAIAPYKSDIKINPPGVMPHGNPGRQW